MRSAPAIRPAYLPAGAHRALELAPGPEPSAGSGGSAPAPPAIDPGARRLEVVCAQPLLHVLELARLYRLLEELRGSFRGEIRVWLTSPLRDRAALAGLPADAVAELPMAAGRVAWPAERAEPGVCWLLLGEPGEGGLAGSPAAPPLARLPLGYEPAAEESAGCVAAANRLFAALRAESPRWRRAAGAPWPIRSLGSRPRILVHQARYHLGDALWLTPLLAGLKGRFPDARVTVAGPPGSEPLLAANPNLDDFWRHDPRSSRRAVERLGGRLERAGFAAAIFAFGRQPECAPLVRRAAAAGVPWRINLEYFDRRWPAAELGADATHEAWFFWGTLASPELLLRALDAFGVPPAEPGEAPRVELPSSAEAERRVAERLAAAGIGEQAFVVLAPGGHSSPRWPARRFAGLARRLTEEHGVHVVVDGGPDESELLAAIAAAAAPPERRGGGGRLLVGQRPLAELAALLDRARLLVANDSAPIHLAEARRTPTLYFAVQEKLVHSHPRGGAWALYDGQANEPRRITVEQALAAIARMRELGLVRFEA